MISSAIRHLSWAIASVVLLAGCGAQAQLGPATPAVPRDAASPRTPSAYHVLHRFGKGADGFFPEARLFNHNGTFYGTTFNARSGWGTVFSITPSGTEKVLHTFSGAPNDGEFPTAGLIYDNGAFYGTTESGGTYCNHSGGCGTVFSITTSGAEKVLHSFGMGSDGADPVAGLIEVSGTLYGTTSAGGVGCGSPGCGTVFSITTSGAEKVLHSFGGYPDGSVPMAALHYLNGTLYGTTYYGGAYGPGIVFSITMSGVEKVLHNFGASGDGALPYAGVIDVRGKLYGTTAAGGEGGEGTVYSISTGGAEKLLYSFAGPPYDGTSPHAALVYKRGTLYGTTIAGGARDMGTLFGVHTSGTAKVLHNFGEGRDGAGPQAGLVYVHGTLYGTTADGGRKGCGGSSRDCGTVFALTP